MNTPTHTATSNRSAKKLIIGLLLVSFGLFVVISSIVSLFDNEQRLFAPSGRLTVEIVETDADRQRGLSGRQGIDADKGMLFVFNDSSTSNCFWMKDMLFTIDMVWFDEDKKVLNTHMDVSPDTYPESFCPEGNAKYGLEVAAGRAQELGFMAGEQIRF